MYSAMWWYILLSPCFCRLRHTASETNSKCWDGLSPQQKKCFHSRLNILSLDAAGSAQMRKSGGCFFVSCYPVGCRSPPLLTFCPCKIQKIWREFQMGFNYAREKLRFERKWQLIRQQYEQAGMSPEDIKQMYDFDWAWFKSQRKYFNHL